MDEYIKKEDVLKEIESTAMWSRPYGELYEAVQNMQATDVAPVRCKDCEYYNRDHMSPGTGWCECLERGEFENHFCSYGERKRGADNG